MALFVYQVPLALRNALKTSIPSEIILLHSPGLLTPVESKLSTKSVDQYKTTPVVYLKVQPHTLENEQDGHSEKVTTRKNSHSDQIVDKGETIPVSQSPTTSRYTYSLQLQNTSLEIQTFFKKFEKFWTRSHNLCSGTAPLVNMAIFDKVRERMSCE